MLLGKQRETETTKIPWGLPPPQSPLPPQSSLPPSPVHIAVHLEAHPLCCPALRPSCFSSGGWREPGRVRVKPGWAPASPACWCLCHPSSRTVTRGHSQLISLSGENHSIAISSCIPRSLPSASGEITVLKDTRSLPFPEQSLLRTDLWERLEQASGVLGTNCLVTSQRCRKDGMTCCTPNIELLIMSQAAPQRLQ